MGLPQMIFAGYFEYDLMMVCYLLPYILLLGLAYVLNKFHSRKGQTMSTMDHSIDLTKHSVLPHPPHACFPELSVN